MNQQSADAVRQPIDSFRKLVIWQRAIHMCVAAYRITEAFPRSEQYGLTNQLRRAAISVPSNIAEGYGRLSRQQYKHFLGIAQGSNLELQTQIVIAQELGYANADQAAPVEQLSAEVGRMLTAMLRRL